MINNSKSSNTEVVLLEIGYDTDDFRPYFSVDAIILDKLTYEEQKELDENVKKLMGILVQGMRRVMKKK